MEGEPSESAGCCCYLFLFSRHGCNGNRHREKSSEKAIHLPIPGHYLPLSLPILLLLKNNTSGASKLLFVFFVFSKVLLILQDETFEIQNETYRGQQYSQIYFARLHMMRTLLYSLVTHWKPHVPGISLSFFSFFCCC